MDQGATAAAARRTVRRERPVFVVGCPRSGTTLLRIILDGHSRLSIPPESHFVVALDRRGDRGLVTVDDILAHPRWEHWDIDDDEVRRAVETRRPTAYAELIRTVFECYAASRGKVRWGDKTPGYVSYIPRLLRLFPEAQIVHIIRDGREVAASMVEQPWGPKRAVVAAYRWRRKVGAGRRAGRRLQPDQYLELRLEDLIAAPELVVRRLCAFLDESFEPEMLDYPARAPAMFPPDDTGTRHVREPLGADIRDWRARLSAREQRAVGAVCHRQLTRLGYEGSRWSLSAAAYGWTVVLGHVVRGAPSAIRVRLAPGRRSY
jgi:hypothetical protein